jgi:alkylation response protein AidB-like acyl-CoA dehydrogenase
VGSDATGRNDEAVSIVDDYCPACRAGGSGSIGVTVDTIQSARVKKPGVDELLDRARAIGALAREHALETEQNRQVSAALIGKMREAGLFRVMQPARFDGFEYGYDAFVELVAAVASGDGSTGWVYSLGAVHP